MRPKSIYFLETKYTKMKVPFLWGCGIHPDSLPAPVFPGIMEQLSCPGALQPFPSSSWVSLVTLVSSESLKHISPLFFSLYILKQSLLRVSSPQLNFRLLLKTPFSLGIFSFSQLAAAPGHFSTVPQLLPVLGSHAGHRDSQAVLTIIGNLTPILGTANVKRSFELSSKKMPENVLLANSC